MRNISIHVLHVLTVNLLRRQTVIQYVKILQLESVIGLNPFLAHRLLYVYLIAQLLK